MTNFHLTFNGSHAKFYEHQLLLMREDREKAYEENKWEDTGILDKYELQMHLCLSMSRLTEAIQKMATR